MILEAHWSTIHEPTWALILCVSLQWLVFAYLSANFGFIGFLGSVLFGGTVNRALWKWYWRQRFLARSHVLDVAGPRVEVERRFKAIRPGPFRTSEVKKILGDNLARPYLIPEGAVTITGDRTSSRIIFRPREGTDVKRARKRIRQVITHHEPRLERTSSPHLASIRFGDPDRCMSGAWSSYRDSFGGVLGFN